TFKYPYVLALLIAVVPAMVFWHIKIEKNKKGSLRYSDTSFVKGIIGSYRILFRHTVPILRILSVALVIFALARPQSGRSFEEVTTQGIDIMLIMDVSASMRAEDFKPKNRLGISKEVIEQFIRGRTHDRLGLVAFAAEAFTLCPLTTDYDMLVNILRGIDFNTVDENRTAIGTALATATNRLRDSKAKSKIIILLTDGSNNAGEIDPVTAAKAAAALGIKAYTIGVGKEGQVPYPVDHPFFGRQYQMVESDIDEETLKIIAAEAGGKFFRAQNAKALREIYDLIDKMEKTEVKSQRYTTYTELFTWFLLIACALLAAEIALANTLFRRIP
ncbi:MAG: aerotolerance regulator BatA, partial [Candidatus Raymondbacteria bacterium RifOxyC12_full_50_8]